jgi:hypothetical protein
MVLDRSHEHRDAKISPLVGRTAPSDSHRLSVHPLGRRALEEDDIVTIVPSDA